MASATWSKSSAGTLMLIPWLARSTFGCVSLVRRLVSTRQSAAQASSVRISVPRLPGISMPSATRTRALARLVRVGGLRAPQEGVYPHSGFEHDVVLIQALGDEHPPRDPGAIVLDIPDQLGRRMPETDLLKLHEQPFLLAARP